MHDVTEKVTLHFSSKVVVKLLKLLTNSAEITSNIQPPPPPNQHYDSVWLCNPLSSKLYLSYL